MFKYVPNDTFIDEQEVRHRWWHPVSGEVVLDVGAAFGSYTLPAAAAGATVYAFSPDPVDTEILKKNVGMNEFCNQVHVFQYGLYNQDGYLDVYDFRKPPRFSKTPTNNLKSYRVKKLDDVVLDEVIPRICWLKIDVEGADPEVLEGGADTIYHDKPKVLIENHTFMEKSLERRVESIMKVLGYVGETVPYETISHTLWLPVR